MLKPMSRREVVVNLSEANLIGDLTVPAEATGVVLFAHGSGSGRLSPRNQFVAAELNRAGLATMLVDLLTVEEEDEDRYSGHIRFDIGLLADRLFGVTKWLAQDPDTMALPLGYFGASTGAAAALVASVKSPTSVKAVVSRGGRPDLAGGALSHVVAPTLLIVGTNDPVVLDLNRQALSDLETKTKQLELVEHATHLFEEPGALEQVANLAKNWFSRFLR